MTQQRYTKLLAEDAATAKVATHQFARDVLLGLSSARRSLPAKYFYDAAGSALFEEITRLPEYYLTDCERDILDNHKTELAERLAGEPFNLVELGPGDGHKSMLLLRELANRGQEYRYLPLDISEAAVATLTSKLTETMPGVSVHGVVADYADGIHWIHENLPGRMAVIFLGSSIGNFADAAARAFLRTLWAVLENGDYLLIGYDLKKSVDVLMRAYDDGAGVTRRFNKNLLVRINRELGGNFDVDAFDHVATYDIDQGSMNSYLMSTRRQTVHIAALSASFEFAPWEAIHVECSHKYSVDDMAILAAATGFSVTRTFIDDRGYFADALWRVEKSTP